MFDRKTKYKNLNIIPGKGGGQMTGLGKIGENVQLYE